MPFAINRIVDPRDLLNRPRISHKISEYILEFINAQILHKSNILQSDKYTYEFTLDFSFEIPEKHRILYRSPYSTERRLFVPHKGFRTFEKATKNAHLVVVADDIDQNIEPAEYTQVVFNMLADYLLFNYRKLKKETFDIAAQKLDISKINSYRFPAPFEDQKYILDDGKYLNGWHGNYATDEEVPWISPEEVYKRHYGF